MSRGKFITFEGGEGSGKSTQASRLVSYLGGQGIETVLTREPGGVPFAEQLREIILSKKPASAHTEFLMFAAARCEHIAGLIEPVLSLGQWVVCDRYIDSTRVYQGRLAGIDNELISVVEQHTVGSVYPDLTFILDLNPRIGVHRAQARGEMSRYDRASDEAHLAIRQGFLDIAAAEPMRCVVVDASEDEEDIARQIAAVVDRRLMQQD